MKKRILEIMTVAVLTMSVLNGCKRLATTEKEYDTGSKDIKSMFVTVECTMSWRVVYDKKTKVMYAVSDYSYGRGVFTELVDENGQPRLWEEKE